MTTTNPPQVESVWPKDLALLVELHKRLETSHDVRMHRLIPELGLDERDAHRSALRLMSGGYIEAKSMDRVTVRAVFRLTERGYRAVGAWPAEGQEAAELFVAILAKAIEDETDPVKRSKLVALRDASISLGMGVLSEFLGSGAAFGVGWN